MKREFGCSGRADSDRYLILGFDTECSRYVDQPERRLENEVLSYQYSCIIAERDGDADSHYRWSGLVRPSGPEIDERLTLTEFIYASLQAGLDAFPDMVLPRSIYLVCHFTRADVPGFKEFKDPASRESLNLQNIRNLFMNVASDIDVEVDGVKLKVKIRDTLSLAPGGARSLAAIGDILGFEKIKVADTPDQELAIKQNMKGAHGAGLGSVPSLRHPRR